MKKEYEAPQIAVENFMLNEFIAGSCQVPINGNDDWLSDLDPFTQAAIKAGQFAPELECTFNADDDNDTLCYHTQGSPLFMS